jgi:hypothetical protein
MVFIFSIPVFGQVDVLRKKINAQFSGIASEQIIETLQNKYNIDFSYKSDIHFPKKKIEIHSANIELKKLLLKIFEDTDIHFIVYENQIILIEKKEIPQKILISGIIRDSENQKPVSYATVYSEKTGQGVIADNNGKFEYETDVRFTGDSLKFASLGYFTQKISLSDLNKNDTVKILLEKHSILIETVPIYAKNFETDVIGNHGLFAFGAIYMDTNGRQTALFIENERKQTGKIISVSFKLSGKGNTEAPFRVRLYFLDTLSGKPGKDLFGEMLVVKPNIRHGWFTVDLSQYNLNAPSEGFFAAMEGVFPNDFDFYFGEKGFTELSEIKNKEDIGELSVSYGQRLSYNRRNPNRTWHYSLSHTWFQIESNNFNVMISAKIQYKIDN